jgi:putative transposase
MSSDALPKRLAISIWGLRSLLTAAGIKISMDGRGRWLDNVFIEVFIERLWRSLKHEDAYLKGYADGLEASAV